MSRYSKILHMPYSSSFSYFPYMSHMSPIFPIHPLYFPYTSHISSISHRYVLYISHMSHTFPMYFPCISHMFHRFPIDFCGFSSQHFFAFRGIPRHSVREQGLKASWTTSIKWQSCHRWPPRRGAKGISAGFLFVGYYK